jgi:hypothetical protein
MAVSDEARHHLYEAISRQYDPEDARTLITLLGYSTNPDELATKVDLLALARQVDLDKLKDEVAVIRGDITDMRGDITDMRGDIAGLQVAFDTLSGRVGELSGDLAGFRDEMRDTVLQLTRAHMSWMLGVLTAYTAMAGLLVALGVLIVS